MSGTTRRGLAGAASAGLLPTVAVAQTNDAGPSLTHRFSLNVKVAPAQELGEVGGGRRRVIPITGGDIKGAGLDGEVLPGGADWQTIRADGVTLLQARYTLRMKDGATVGIINTGIRRAPIEIVRRLTAGEIVAPSLYYFRTSAVFEVGPGPYQWLTESIFVCVGERLPDVVRMKVFQVA